MMQISFSQKIGTRESQEDFIVVLSTRNATAAHILDGHSGQECAELAATCLEQDIIPKFDIKQENEEIVRGLQMVTHRFKQSGSTLSSAYIVDGKLYLSVLGDSPIYVFNKRKIFKPAQHNKFNEKELADCESRGGILKQDWIINKETKCGLATFRHLGRTDMGDITNREPEFYEIGEDWSTVIISSDGLVLPEKEIKSLYKFGAEALLQKNSEIQFNKHEDNASVIIISK